jgi:hypothetical protein
VAQSIPARRNIETHRNDFTGPAVHISGLLFQTRIQLQERR